MTQKRPSSPLPVQNCKKRATLTDGSYGRINGDSHESLHMILQRVLAEQVELVEELVFKDSECQRLKKKFDEVDRNCRRWHEFAIGLQSRVKRLALILHRQQDSILNLKNKGVSMVDAAVQTEFDQTTSKMHDTCSARIHGTESKGKRDCLDFEKASCLYIATSSDSALTKCDDDNKPTGKKDEIELSFEPDPGAVPHSSVVIDLTDEETMKNSLSGVNTSRLKDPLPSKLKNAVAGIADNASVVNSIGFASGGISSKTQLIAGVPGKNYPVANGGHHKPLVAVQQVKSSFDSLQVQQVNHVPVCLKTKANAQKTNNTPVKDDHLAAQKPIGLSISPAKNNVGNAAPYPLLPSMPLPPQNLPKNIPPSPSQPMLRIRKSKDGIELSWDHPSIRHVKMDSYDLFVFQHNPNSHSSNRWKKIGSDPIKAMPLPMACTLSQFSTGSKYYFVVRGKDFYGRYGPFSAPCCSTDVQQ